MKYHPIFITGALVVFSSLGILGCKRKEPNGSSRTEPPQTKKTLSDHPAAEPPQRPPVTDPFKEAPFEKNLSQYDIEVFEAIRKKQEPPRAVVFAVPLDEAASRDRAEAWEKLTQRSFTFPLVMKQQEYALNLLKSYENGTQLEKLVFWRLVRLRWREQGFVSGSGRTIEVLDGSDVKLNKDLSNKLRETLYSGLGVDSSTDYDTASKQAIQILENAGKSPE